jgi:Fic family protein
MNSYKPPYTITSVVVNLIAKITEALTRRELASEHNLRLRRINRIQTIQGSLAIEGNNLSSEQITAILEDKPVMGSMREIQEVRNAIQAYENFENWNPYSMEDLLDAHKILTTGLIDDSGCFRSAGVGEVSGSDVIHVAQPADRVSFLIKDLLLWLKETDEHPLIAGSVFHYEFEFIHPFSDGNGRAGRLWQTLILSHWNKQFAHLPVESLIYKNQSDYCNAIHASSLQADCAPFIEFMLKAIYEAITTQETPQETTQEKILQALKVNPKMTRVELAKLLGITPDGVKYHLQKMVKAGIIKHVGATKAGEWVIL